MDKKQITINGQGLKRIIISLILSFLTVFVLEYWSKVEFQAYPYARIQKEEAEIKAHNEKLRNWKYLSKSEQTKIEYIITHEKEFDRYIVRNAERIYPGILGVIPNERLIPMTYHVYPEDKLTGLWLKTFFGSTVNLDFSGLKYGDVFSSEADFYSFKNRGLWAIKAIQQDILFVLYGTVIIYLAWLFFMKFKLQVK